MPQIRSSDPKSIIDVLNFLYIQVDKLSELQEWEDDEYRHGYMKAIGQVKWMLRRSIDDLGEYV